MTWDYSQRLDKHSTNKIEVYKNVVSGSLILHDAEDFATKQVYMGYSIQESKRMFRDYLKGIR